MSRPIAMTLISATLLMAGCSSVKNTYHEKFEDQTVLSTDRFADTTIAMLGNLELQFKPDDVILVKRFVEVSAPEETQAKTLHDDMLKGIAAIVWYSVELVDINRTAKTELERVARYGAYLDTLRERAVMNGRCSAVEFDRTMDQVLAQETLLEALRAAEPLLNTLISDSALQIGDLIDSVDALSLAISHRVDEEYAKIIHARNTLEREKFDILEAYETIYEAYRSDSPNLDKLKESGVIWDPGIIPEGEPTMEDLEKIGAHLSRRMAALRSVQQEVEPDWQQYLEVHKEMDHLAQQLIRDARRTRVLLLTWIKAHHSLTEGTIQQAEWFDITKLGNDLIRSAPSAIVP